MSGVEVLADEGKRGRIQSLEYHLFFGLCLDEPEGEGAHHGARYVRGFQRQNERKGKGRDRSSAVREYMELEFLSISELTGGQQR